MDVIVGGRSVPDGDHCWPWESRRSKLHGCSEWEDPGGLQKLLAYHGNEHASLCWEASTGTCLLMLCSTPADVVQKIYAQSKAQARVNAALSASSSAVRLAQPPGCV